MTHDDTLQRYKAMTNAERAEVTCRLMRENWPSLLHGTAEVVARRFERLNAENHARNVNMLMAIARTRLPAAPSANPSPQTPLPDGERGEVI